MMYMFKMMISSAMLLYQMVTDKQIRAMHTLQKANSPSCLKNMGVKETKGLSTFPIKLPQIGSLFESSFLSSIAPFAMEYHFFPIDSTYSNCPIKSSHVEISVPCKLMPPMALWHLY